MMMQSSGTETLFSNGSLFETPSIRVLWPLRHAGFEDVEQDFLRRRTAMMDSIMKDFCQAFPYDFLKGRGSSPAVGRLALLGAGSPSEKPGPGDKFELALDVREFSLEDITVRLVGRKLVVTAVKQEEPRKGAGKDANLKEFSQEIELSERLNLAALTCSLTADGLLKIEAPPVQPSESEERQVPIRFRTSLNVPICNSQNKEASTAKKP
ncbi:heat shock protein beta-9 [Lepisosteus oculatus]|uniref:heat shock protein beta-9 n=1 Tax=Lepisosteus oculatus TaxID=7918 RepID=UPI003721E1F2